MSQLDARNRLIRDSLLMVLVSFLLYRMMFTNILFTIPLLLLAPRFEDRKMAMLPFAGVLLLIVASELYTVRSVLGRPTTMLVLAIGLFIPVALLVAAAVWTWLREKRDLVRYLGSCLFAVIAGIALVAWLNSGSETVMKVGQMYASTFEALFSSLMPSTALLPTEEITQAVVETNVFGMDISTLFAMSLQVVYYSFVPMCMALIGVSSLLSDCMLHRTDMAWQDRVSAWRMPETTIWVFLGSWALVLFDMLLHLPGVVSALVMNLALAVSLLYLVQGMSIIVFLLRKRNPAVTATRVVILVLLSMLLPGLNVLVVLVLPLLGALETWIRFRKND